MDSMDAAKALRELFGVDWSEARKAVEAEADDMKNDLAKAGARRSYQDRIDTAYDRIRGWLDTADEYAIKLEWGDIARFSSDHRAACVWAVLTGKALALKKATVKP